MQVYCKIKHSSHHSPKPELFLSVSQHEAGLIKYSSLHFSPIFTGLTILLILLNPVKYLCSYFCIVDIAEWCTQFLFDNVCTISYRVAQHRVVFISFYFFNCSVILPLTICTFDKNVFSPSMFETIMLHLVYIFRNVYFFFSKVLMYCAFCFWERHL